MLKNRTQFPTTFVTSEGRVTVPVADEGPAFLPSTTSAAPPLLVDGVHIPVERQALGTEGLALNSSKSPLIVPIPTAQFLAAEGQCPDNVFVALEAQRDEHNQITGFGALGRVTYAPGPQTLSSVADDVRELRVLTAHAITVRLGGDPASEPDLTLPSAVPPGEPVGRQSEEIVPTSEVVTLDGLDVPVRDVRYGDVALPDPVPGTGFVVSLVTASAARRGDLYSPKTLVGPDKQPAGCTALRQIR